MVSAVGAVCVGAVLTWALWPLESREEFAGASPVATVGSGEDRPVPAADELDAQRFAVALWNPPPPPADAETAPKENKPVPLQIRLQLLGIVESSSGAAPGAILYNPDADEILIVAAGERIGPLAVSSVTAQGVELEDDRQRRITLELLQPPTAQEILRAMESQG
jgi:hypothetical protein